MENFIFYALGNVHSKQYSAESIGNLGVKIQDLAPVHKTDLQAPRTFRNQVNKWIHRYCSCHLCKVYVAQVGFLQKLLQKLLALMKFNVASFIHSIFCFVLCYFVHSFICFIFLLILFMYFLFLPFQIYVFDFQFIFLNFFYFFRFKNKEKC